MADGVAAQAGYDVLKSLVTGWLWPRIKRHLDYLRRFRLNVEGLRNEIGLLEAEMRNMDQKVEEARLRAEILRPTDVEVWKKDCDQKLADAEKIHRGCGGLKAWKIIPRYSWGKKAKRTADKIALLRNEADKIKISDPAPIPASDPIHHEPAMEFDSRRRVEEDIMKFLKDGRVRMVAICGAGGVGKTTMVQRIEDRVRGEENLFDEVVHVVVSQQIDLPKLQKQIAELLGLKFSEDTLAARAHKLHIRLQDSKRKLIVFDDVWDSFNLAEIGVPSGNGFPGCKIILTSRVRDACKKMGAQEIIQMEVLTKEEAWDLFKEKAGSYVEDPDLLPIAKDVAEECNGLPVALVIVGRALQDKGIHVWKDSLSQLRRSMPLHVPDFIKLVYTPLKLSYDFFEDESVRSLFLLCCMFPEDYNIPIEYLTLYSIGLDMFEGVTNIEEGRNRTYSFVEELKSRFLLLDAEEGQSVRMHDVVRDVAIYIGSKEKNGFLKRLDVSSMDLSSKDLSSECSWMSIDFQIGIGRLHVGSSFPNLRFLMIRDSRSNDINAISFDGMKGLNVLSISRKDFRSLFPTLELLKLRVLHLNDCSDKDISVLGEIASLEILCIHDSEVIEVLPAAIGRLNRLKVLELIRCWSLEKIVVGVISSLVRLEALAILGCRRLKWEAKGSESERSAGLSELESLCSLTSLEIDISDHNLFAEEMCLSQKLVRYSILYEPAGLDYDRQFCAYDRKISLYLPGDIAVGNWVHQLVRSTQSLVSRGDDSKNLLVAESIKDLTISDCSTMKKLVNGMDCKLPVLERLQLSGLTELEEIIDCTIPEGFNSFQRLQSLSVKQLPKLAHLWKSQNQNVWLGNLKSIFIEGCPNLCHVFSLATARSLVQLQSFEICSCSNIQHLFWNEMELSNKDASSVIQFPKLQKLELFKLPNLTIAFCRGVEGVKFPKLEEMVLGNLPRLKSLLPVDLDLEASHDDHHLHFFCNPKVEIPALKALTVKRLEDTISEIWCPHVPINFFHNLEELNVYYANGISNLMSSSIAKNLVNLSNLQIFGCQEMVDVMEDEKEVSATPLFRKLRRIAIADSYKLRSFCRWNRALELPSLEEVSISHCPGMETFTLGNLSTPYLSDFSIGYEQVETKDLNDGIRHWFSNQDR